MSCEEAQKKVNEFLKEQDLDQYVSEDQVKEIVSACCDDMGSQECVNAMATIAATGACVAYTEGACVPCCSVAGRIVGPIVGKSLGAAWSLLKGVWSTVSGWFGGGECDYDPAAGAIIVAYSDAMRELGAGLQTAWDESRAELRLEPKWALFSTGGPGGYMVPVTMTPEKIALHMGTLVSATWEEALLHNSIKFSKRYGPPHFKWTIAGKDGYLYSPPVDINQTGTPEQFFGFSWKDYPCNESGNWQDAAKHVSGIRMGFVEDAAAWMLQKMVISLSQEAEVVNIERVHELRAMIQPTPMPQFKVQPTTQQKSPLKGMLLIGGALALAAGAVYYYNKQDALAEQTG
jgi:hypothetical protein